MPLVARGCEQLVLCGDHYQLPPSTACREAVRRGATVSLYERLVAQGVAPFHLDTQVYTKLSRTNTPEPNSRTNLQNNTRTYQS